MFGQLERKTGINLGPPGKAKLIYFMDDLNLPEVDPYNTQSAISLLRQVMEYKHWFDRAKLAQQNILNTQVVAGMNPTAGSFLIDPRLQRHFCTFAMGMPEAPSLVTIYETFLGGHLSTFNDELSNSQFSNALIKAALALHTSVVNTFRKTAANFHYEFNVRHLSNVFQGLIASKKQRFTTTEKFIYLWLHESERVYGDRLVSKSDIEKYNALVQLQVKRSFPACNTSRYYAAENSWPLIFCHFTRDGDREYDQITGTNLDDLKKNLDTELRDYNNNENNTAMHLDLFDDAVKHVARIVRILRNESGHALLVGVGGSGKRSLARLASHICGFTVRQITISSKYGENEFKEDLRKMHLAVVDMLSRNEEDGGIVFMLTDSQITNEKFLIYLNDLLASGEIPDLFAVEDFDNIANVLSPVAGTKDRKEVLKFFQAEIRKRLHLCLCFSPVGDDFRNRARKFPALVNCTVIDWFQPWPKEALLSVGREKLKEISDMLGDDNSRAGIENFMPFSFPKRQHLRRALLSGGATLRVHDTQIVSRVAAALQEDSAKESQGVHWRHRTSRQGSSKTQGDGRDSRTAGGRTQGQTRGRRGQESGRVEHRRGCEQGESQCRGGKQEGWRRSRQVRRDRRRSDGEAAVDARRLGKGGASSATGHGGAGLAQQEGSGRV
ncbi:hypothetical protein PINS_up000202 [Pythium insidiosum]|nr:hypothetical protein PINS_up000202 [Pythium insidiosum]